MFSNSPSTSGQYTIESYEGVTFCWIKCPSYNPKSIMRFIVMFIFTLKVLFIPKAKIGKPDNIIVSSMPIFPIVSGYILKKIYGANKLIFEIRDLWPLTLIHLKNLSNWHPLVVFIGWFEKFGYKNSDYIVSLLPNSKNHIDGISGLPSKFINIQNGVDLSLVKQNFILKSSYFDKISKDDFVIGYAGTIGIANALEYILDAAKGLKQNIKIVVVGKGYLKDTYIEKYKEYSNIIFLPAVKKNQVQEVLNRFDVCMISWHNLPLYQLGVSANKYFDYMLSAKPILSASNIPSNPVELANCGLIVEPESSKAILSGIEFLYNLSEKERNKMGARGKEYVMKYHTYEYLSKKYTEIF